MSPDTAPATSAESERTAHSDTDTPDSAAPGLPEWWYVATGGPVGPLGQFGPLGPLGPVGPLGPLGLGPFSDQPVERVEG